MKNERISRVMTEEPAVIGLSDSIAAAEGIMREQGCHHVPVVDDVGRIVGMISALDLLKALVLESDVGDPLQRRTLEERPITDIMHRNVVSLSQTSTVLDAARALANGNVHAVPVLAPGGVLAGIATSTDLIGFLADALEHPVAPVAKAPSVGEEVSSEQVRLLREVCRATIRYLESGGDEMEHTRLVQAVSEIREGIAPADLPI